MPKTHQIKYILLLLTTFSILSSSAQNDSMSQVSFQVMDARFGNRIPCAQIFIIDSVSKFTFSVKTDSSGNAFIGLPMHKKYAIFSSVEGDTNFHDYYYDSELYSLITDSTFKDLTMENDPMVAFIHYTLPAFHFKHNTTELEGEESIKAIDECYKMLTKFPSIVIELRGYADCKQPERKSFQLSLARAEYVRKLLIEKGIKEGRLIATGRGSLMPSDDCCSGKSKCSNEELFLRYNVVHVRLLLNIKNVRYR